MVDHALGLLLCRLYAPRGGHVFKHACFSITCPNPLRPRASRLERQGDQFLIACGSSKTVSVTVQAPSADCPCGDAGTVGVEIYSISADDTRGIAVAISVCGYTLVADRTRRPAVAVAISADVLTADPARRIAVLISVGVHGAIAVTACRITRSIRVQGAALGVHRQSGYRQRQGCKNEARHRTPPLLTVCCNDAGRL